MTPNTEAPARIKIHSSVLFQIDDDGEPFPAEYITTEEADDGGFDTEYVLAPSVATGEATERIDALRKAVRCLFIAVDKSVADDVFHKSEEVIRLLTATPATGEATCEWVEGLDGKWRTTCGRVAHQYAADGLGPNAYLYTFCGFCGKSLREVRPIAGK